MLMHEKIKVIEEQIKKATVIMQSMPDVKGKGFVSAFAKSGMYSSDTKPTFVPTPEEIDFMWKVAYDWMNLIPVEDRKLVWFRCAGMSWKQVAYRNGISRSTAIRRFNQACMRISRSGVKVFQGMAGIVDNSLFSLGKNLPG